MSIKTTCVYVCFVVYFTARSVNESVTTAHKFVTGQFQKSIPGDDKRSLPTVKRLDFVMDNCPDFEYLFCLDFE